MACYATTVGGNRAIICGRLGPHCSCCAGVSGFQCDYPVDAGKTCDRHLCANHAIEVGENRHVCPSHHSALAAEAAAPLLLTGGPCAP